MTRTGPPPQDRTSVPIEQGPDRPGHRVGRRPVGPRTEVARSLRSHHDLGSGLDPAQPRPRRLPGGRRPRPGHGPPSVRSVIASASRPSRCWGSSGKARSTSAEVNLDLDGLRSDDGPMTSADRARPPDGRVYLARIEDLGPTERGRLADLPRHGRPRRQDSRMLMRHIGGPNAGRRVVASSSARPAANARSLSTTGCPASPPRSVWRRLFPIYH